MTPAELWECRRAYHKRLAEAPLPDARLFVAVPTRGTLAPEMVQSVWKLQESATLTVGQWMLQSLQTRSQDVVRVRNQFAHYFLTQTDATHMLFVDDDVEFEPHAIEWMLKADRGLVACPYPRRGRIDWDRVEDLAISPTRDMRVPLEAMAYDYSVRSPDATPNVDEQGCADVEGMPMGCALIRRRELQRVTDCCTSRYREALPDGRRVTVANLFGLLIAEGPEGGLLSEDYSFCHRWRHHGEKVWMYLGLGSPVTHHGSYPFRGQLEAFNLARRPT